MALDRTWLTGRVDDDGTGTTGSVIDKAFITHIYDDVDVDLATRERTANKNAASGYAGLDGSSKLTGSQQVYGTTANTAAQGNDARLTDARTPTAHGSSHLSGGSDAIKLDDLATPDDNTDLNASSTRHGLLPKLPTTTTTFLRGDGAFTSTLTGDVLLNGLTVGRGAGGDASNTALGAGTLAANTTGTAHTAVGSGALASTTTTDQNTACGYLTLTATTTGRQNTAVGCQALMTNVTGMRNVAVGAQALRLATVDGNTAIGFESLYFLTTGTNNVCLGFESGRNMTVGYSNTLLGNHGGWSIVDGGSNIAIGDGTLYSTTSGNNNTGVGHSALTSNVTGSGNVGLGYKAGAYATGSDELYIDNQDRTNTAGDKAGALLYGTFNSTPASQTLTVNGLLTSSVAIAGPGTVPTTGDFRAKSGFTFQARNATNTANISILSTSALDVTYLNGQTIALLNNVAVSIGTATQGFLAVLEVSNGMVGVYILSGALHTVTLVAQDGASFTKTAGTVGAANVYWSVANSRYELENKLGSGRSFCVIALGR